MKKILFTVAAAALLGLAACGGTTEPSSVVPSEEPISQDSATPSEDSTSHETPVSSEEDSPYEKITVAEIIAWCNEQDSSVETKDTDTIFEVKGIIEGLTEGDKYGNGFLTDGDSTIIIYGSTTDETAISGDPGTYNFVNPKKGVTGIANGEEVTMHVIRDAYKGKPEIMGVYVDHKASSNRYTVTVAEATNGTVSVDKTADLAYGDPVVITATPAEGYVVENVIVKTAFGSIKATENEDGTYTFGATCANEVVVTFAVPASNEIKIDLTSEYSGDNITFSETVTYSTKFKEYSFAKYNASKTTPSAVFTAGGKKIASIDFMIYTNHWNGDVYAGTDATGTVLDASAPKGVSSSVFSTNQEFTFTLDCGDATSVYMESKNTQYTIGMYGVILHLAD